MKVIIIGGVAAGMSAASKIVRTDRSAQVTAYEKSRFFSYAACGLPYYVGGLNHDYRRMIARSQEEFARQGIVTKARHEVKKIHPDQKIVEVKNLETGESFIDSYDKLLIATGARAFVPSVPGTELMGVHVLRTMEDGIFLKELAADPGIKKAVIVGGGYVGVECADAFSRLGKEVTIVTSGSGILKDFDEDMGALALEELLANGIQVRLKERLTACEGKGYVNRIRTDKGSYEADLVLLATGTKPNTEFLEGTGIALASNGAVLVDRYFQTSLPDIYGAGDCATVYNSQTESQGYHPFATVANKAGRIAGLNMAGGKEPFYGALGSSAIQVCRLEFGRTGLTEKEAKKKGIPVKSVVVRSYDHPAYYPEPTILATKVIYEEGSRKLLGAQICGQKGAAVRTDIFAVAIQAGMTAKQLGMTDLIYAPPFAGVWDAVQLACNAAK